MNFKRTEFHFLLRSLTSAFMTIDMYALSYHLQFWKLRCYVGCSRSNRIQETFWGYTIQNDWECTTRWCHQTHTLCFILQAFKDQNSPVNFAFERWHSQDMILVRMLYGYMKSLQYNQEKSLENWKQHFGKNAPSRTQVTTLDKDLSLDGAVWQWQQSRQFDDEHWCSRSATGQEVSQRSLKPCLCTSTAQVFFATPSGQWLLCTLIAAHKVCVNTRLKFF